MGSGKGGRDTDTSQEAGGTAATETLARLADTVPASTTGEEGEEPLGGGG